MLPSKYIISDSDRSTATRSNAQRHHHSLPPPPLGITGVICSNRMIDLPNQRGQLHCTIYRPRMLEQPSSLQSISSTAIGAHTNQPPTFHNHVVPKLPKPNPPLICVAGGPGMSCQYLSGLVHLIPDRAIIIYDHYNCGQSTNTFSAGTYNNSTNTPRNTTSSITQVVADDDQQVNENEFGKRCSFLNDTVDDLAALIEAIIPSKTTFHLYGHSMGGIIAYEYLKRSNVGRRYCNSCIFASTPTNIAASYQSKEELISSIMEELNEKGYQNCTKKLVNDDDNDESSGKDDSMNDIDDEGDEQQIRQAAHVLFQQRHECRTVPLPSSLQQSLTGLKNGHMNTMGNSNKQHQHKRRCGELHPASLNEYIAAPSTLEIQLPPVLIVRGQFDFVSEDNCRYWEDIYQLCGDGNQYQYITISDCSHYGFLEQENLYGSVVLSFLNDHDKNNHQARVDYV